MITSRTGLTLVVKSLVLVTGTFGLHWVESYRDFPGPIFEKHQHSVEEFAKKFDYGSYVEFQKPMGKPCTFQRKIICL